MTVLFFTGELSVTVEDARDIGTEPVEDPASIGTILDGCGPEHRPSFFWGKSLVRESKRNGQNLGPPELTVAETVDREIEYGPDGLPQCRFRSNSGFHGIDNGFVHPLGCKEFLEIKGMHGQLLFVSDRYRCL